MFRFVVSPTSLSWRQPLRDAKAGEGRRPRDVEDYLTGLLREIPPVKLVRVPSRDGSKETSTKMAVFARRKCFSSASLRHAELILINPEVADALEAKVAAVNQHPVLQCPTNNPQTGRGTHLEQTEDRIKKNRREKTKRGCERHHLERISRLFNVTSSEQTWTRADVLIFGMVVYCW